MALHLKSTGIDFADISSGDVLDDYEEGTWTPTITNASSYSAQLGTYTKVGNIVSIAFDMTCAFTASGTAAQVFGGFPFTLSASPELYPQGVIFPVVGWNPTDIHLIAQGSYNNTQATLYSVATATSTNYTAVRGSMFGTSVVTEFSMVYTAA
jgi:hypothetical protein